MANQDGFVIMQNRLCGYSGHSKRIVVPDSVTEIDLTFWGSVDFQELVIPDSVQSVHRGFQLYETPEHFNLIAPTAVIETVWSNLSPPYKTGECLGYLCGTFQRHPRYTDVIRTYIKKNKKKYFKMICDCDSVEMMEKFLDCLPPVKLGQLDEYIAAAVGCVNLTAFLLNYKKEHFTSQQIQALSEEAVEKELGIREKTVSDWRKIFKFTISDGCVEIVSYRGADTCVVIPDKIGRNAVTAIAGRAFMQREDLTGITLPDSITQICAQAFICCTGLTEFTIPERVTHLANGVFAGYTELTAIQIPNGITKINSTTFFGCTNLASVHIPITVTDICGNSFDECPKLTIYAPAGSYAETYAKEHNIPFVAE